MISKTSGLQEYTSQNRDLIITVLSKNRREGVEEEPGEEAAVVVGAACVRVLPIQWVVVVAFSEAHEVADAFVGEEADQLLCVEDVRMVVGAGFAEGTVVGVFP